MKASVWLVVVPIMGSMAQAESLGDAAKRERERREKKGGVVKAPVIREEELVAGPGKAAKGTFNPAAGPVGGRANKDLKQPSSPSESDGPLTEVDNRRAAARGRLEASYETIRETAGSLMHAVSQYGPCEGVIPVSTSCDARLRHIWKLAMSVGLSMEDAEEAARQGWLAPGDVRDARQRYGMDDAFWDELVRLVHQYRR
jgi:hypothetical protein